MSFSFNRRIVDTISEFDCDPKLKELLTNLLYVEIRNYDSNTTTYSNEYDKIIKKFSEDYGED